MRTTWIAVVMMAGCGGASGGKDTIGHHEAAPPGGLVVDEVGAEQVMECARHDLALRVGGDEVMLEGTCQGACTEAAKAAGEAQIAEIEAAIARGESSESELDYDFTSCTFFGVSPGRSETIAGRGIELLVGYHPGPHDVPNRFFQLATELCGKVFLSDELGATYADRWQLDDLRLAADGDAITVTVDDEGAPRELYRVRFAGCTAEQQVGDAGG